MKKNEIGVLARFFKTYIKDIITIGGICIASILYIYDLTNSLTALEPRVSDLEIKIIELQKDSEKARSEIRQELNDSNKKFEIISVKLETSLKEISTDLQFIKQRLLEKSLKN